MAFSRETEFTGVTIGFSWMDRGFGGLCPAYELRSALCTSIINLITRIHFL